MEGDQEVVIVGAGIAGLATAMALQRVGVRSLVLERSHKLRATGTAIGLRPNAWRALDALGVAHKLAPFCAPIQTGCVTNIVSGATQEMSMGGTTSSTVVGPRVLHRKILLEALAEELPPGAIRFSSKLASIKAEVWKDSSITTVLLLEDGTVIRAKVLIGCDGVHSVVAQWLGLSAPINSGRSAIRGMSVFPEGHGFDDKVQQFLGPSQRAGFVPLNDRELYWFITHKSLPREKELARDPEHIQKKVLESLAKDFPPAYLDVVRHSDLSSPTWAPLMFRTPWDVILGPAYRGCVTVAGDAFHPMTPDLGQGGGSALEDAVVLVRNIACPLGRSVGACSSKEVERGIEAYVKERRWRAAGLITGAYFSGWVQQGGIGLEWWIVRLLRDTIFYRFVLPRIVDDGYDCGTLPAMV